MTDDLSVEVPTSLDGVRVDRAVALLADISRAAVDDLVAGGRVQVDGEVVRVRSRSLSEGEQLTVQLRDQLPPEAPRPDPTVPFEVVYADDDVVVVDKPAGLVVHPGAGHPDGTLVNGVLARYPEVAELAGLDGADLNRPGIVHRLDKDTSGCLVVAKNDETHLALAKQFEERTVEKLYDAIVLGILERDTGEIRASIARHPSHRKRMAVLESSNSRFAHTSYRVIERLADT